MNLFKRFWDIVKISQTKTYNNIIKNIFFKGQGFGISINEKKSETVKDKSLEIYKHLSDRKIDVFYDDRGVSPGVKFSDANLMGNPYQIVISEKNLDKNVLEIINRKDQSKSEISEKDLLSLFD